MQHQENPKIHYHITQDAIDKAVAWYRSRNINAYQDGCNVYIITYDRETGLSYEIEVSDYEVNWRATLQEKNIHS